MKTRGVVVLCGVGLLAGLATPVVGQTSVTALVDVSVIPMDRERVLSHQTVLVRGDRITALGPVGRIPVPTGAMWIDGRGKFLIPGLADMHVHAVRRWRNTIDNALFAYVANGVTTIREMHGGGRTPRANSVLGGGINTTETDSFVLALKRRLARGEVLGPRLYTAGDPDLTSPADAARSVAELKADGHDFVKISFGARWPAPKPVYDSILAVAQRVHLPVVGHVPPGLDPTQLAAPWASAEHLYEYTEYLLGLTGRWSRTDDGMLMTMRRELVDTAAWMRPDYRLDRGKLRRLTQSLKRAGIWSCPTLSLLAAMRAGFGSWWSADRLPDSLPFAKWFAPVVGKRYFDFDRQITKALQDAGAGLLLGTDDENPFAVHGELAALVDAGLTPYQALATGTRNVARFLGTQDSSGTVAVGKRADLVLLDANPLEDIRHTMDLAGVMTAGRWLPRAMLDARLDSLGLETQRESAWRRIAGERPSGERPSSGVPARARESQPLVFDGVTVVDVAQGQLLPNQRVVIAGRHLKAVGAASAVKVSKRAQVIDARGKYLIPGLWDMHLHLWVLPEVVHPLLLANGITGFRNVGTGVPLDTLKQWRREILAGTRVGPPRQLFAGPALNDPPMGGEPRSCRFRCFRGHETELPIRDTAEMRHVVDSLKAAGADFIKTRVEERSDIYWALVSEAHRVGIPFAGHLPRHIEQAVLVVSDSGQRTIEHEGGLDGTCEGDSATVARCRPIAERHRRNDTWDVLGPTWTATAPSRVSMRERWRRTRYWPDSVTREWKTPADSILTREPDTALRVKIKALYHLEVAEAAGLPLLIGTDVGAPIEGVDISLPGFQLHDDLATYVDGGLTPLAALRAVTLNPAKMLHATDSLGTVARGKLADLVLLDANPLADIGNTTTIRAVVADGRYYDRAALDTLLRQLRQADRP